MQIGTTIAVAVLAIVALICFKFISVLLRREEKAKVERFLFELYCVEILIDFFDPRIPFREGPHKALNTDMLCTLFTNTNYAPSSTEQYLRDTGQLEEDALVRIALKQFSLESNFVGVYSGGTELEPEKLPIIDDCRKHIDELRASYTNKTVPYEIAKREMEYLERQILRLMDC